VVVNSIFKVSVIYYVLSSWGRHTVPVALARPFPVVVLAESVEFVCIWDTVWIDTYCVGRHLDVGTFGEDGAVV
jgi:hypothetical protein